jgi:cytochrome bd-type quinol oxidase subunit 1/mono/diheme cytochrome c family protein
MHYPWWYVPVVTAPMLIAAVSVVHVLVSHYAVGGGLFLAVETAHAYRTKDQEYLAYLRGHTKFFVWLTVVFGAITGVGIWWTIGLASPLATEVLIRTFVFGWATEYVFFVVEIASAFIFLYCWGRLPEKTHVAVGWIYAAAAWISLVLITGITAFMLHPGAWLNEGTRNFWTGFFNPQFLPQTVARTGGALLLSSLYVYLHASLTLREQRLRDLIASRSARPAMLGAVFILVGGLGWYAFLPESAKAALGAAAVLTVLVVLIFAMTVVVFVLLYLGPYRNPGWLSPGFAGVLALFGIAAFGTGEFIREAVRKPYVLYNVVLSNQIYPAEVAQLRAKGYLEGAVPEGRSWTNAYIQRHYPKAMDPADPAKIDEKKLLDLPREDQIKVGAVLFQYHCNDCHAIHRGYSPVAMMLHGRTEEMHMEMIEDLDRAPFFMPPWAGTREEAKLLAAYLASISPPRPAGMVPN